MWKPWIFGITTGLLAALLLYLAIDKINRTAERESVTSSENLAEAMAEKKQLEQQLAELTGKSDDGTSAELEQDIVSLKGSLTTLASDVKKACGAPATPPSPPPAPPPPVGKTGGLPGPPTLPTVPPLLDSRWQEAQSSAYKLQNTYFAIEQRYVAGNQARALDPSTAVARSELEDIQSRLRPNWNNSTTAEACSALQEHRALANVDTSTIVAPFSRVKQRIERERLETANKITKLNKRGEELNKQLLSLQSRLGEGPKLIVVKYLPLAMAIILAFGGLLFLAARIIPDPILARLVDSGQLIQFPTVVILFAVILVLALAEGLTKDHTATLLAAIAGYILGSTRSSSNGKPQPIEPEPKAPVDATQQPNAAPAE
jgi:phage shock protein A